VEDAMNTLRSNWFRRAAALLTIVTLAGLALVVTTQVGERRIYAQALGGAAYPPGYFAGASNASVNAAIGSALAVTNPASNFLVLVQGGPVYFSGSEQIVGQSTIQLAASNTYLIVWNGLAEQLYAKTAVTAPGTGTTPGTPATLLFALPNVEVPIATVVCNATACGNGGNGTITDARPVANFPGAGTALNTTTFANLPTSNVTDGTMILCSSCTQPTTGSATCTSGAANVLAVRVAATWRCY
jgi:hypothetical protein